MSRAVPVSLFVPNPTLTSVTPTGGAAGHMSYEIVGVAADGTKTAASAAVSTTTGPTTLDNTHFNALAWTDPLNVVTILLYRTAGGPSQGLIASVAAGVQAYQDKGAAGDGATPSAANGTGIGGGVPVESMADLTVQIGGTFVATLQIQGRIDPCTDWRDIGTAQTGAGLLDVTATAKSLSQIRCKCTAFTSGSPVVAVAGN